MFWGLLRRFGRNERGVIAIIVALAFVPMVLATGAAVDFARASLVKARLGVALDAAGLAVGASDPNSADLQNVLQNFFDANFPTQALVTPTGLGMTIEGGEISLSASARVETTFLKIINKNFFDVEVTAKVTRETTGLEVVLVLDNTGSMASNNKIFSLKVASQDLIDVLFGEETEPEKLHVGLVPFVTTVNIGAQNEAVVNFPTPDNQYPPNIDNAWKGCVEARQFPNDVRDTFIAGNLLQGEWSPYYWEAETYYSPTLSNVLRSSSCRSRWWRPPNPQPIALPPLPRPTGRSGDPAFTGNDFRSLDITPSTTRGPNQACPDPITPLTNIRVDLEAAIAQMQPWSGNGTMVNLGAVWGLRVLSPGAPFTEGLPFGTEGNRKAMIILTDGINIFSSVSSRCTGTNPRYSSQYTGYGYLSEGRLGTTNRAAAQTELNNRFATVCQNIKDTGIIVYTIVFQLDDPPTQALFQTCASDADKYFNSPSAEDLRTAFRAIAAELSNLRISQ